jgi:hypothetical protein
MINSSDPAMADISGISAQITTFSMPAFHGNGTAGIEVSIDITTRGQTISVGLEANSTVNHGAVEFFASVINATSHNVTSAQLGSSPAVGSLAYLEIAPTAGNTWACYAENQVLLNTSIPSSNGSLQVDTSILTGWSNSPWVPQDMFMPQALDVRTPSGWYIPHPAYAEWAGLPIPSFPKFSFVGANQDLSLAPGEFEAGTNVSSPTNGTSLVTLWSTTPAKHATLYGFVAPAEVTGGKNVTVSWQATSDGSPLDGVRVAFWSSLGGLVGGAVTNAAGWANSTYPTPVVTQPAVMFLNASIENGTYIGFSNISLLVFPARAIQLTVTLTPHVVQGAPAGMVEIVASVTQSGSPMGGVVLLPQANIGGGVFSPYAPWVTNNAGYVYANYTVPSIYGNVTVWANVSGIGYAGSGNVTLVVNVGHAPSNTSSSNTLWPYELGAVLAAVIVIIAMVALAARRRASQAEEEEDEKPAEKSSSEKDADKKA